MPRLGDIRGQDRAVALLRRQLAGGRLPHALLFVGPAGVGKHTTALALARAVNCETPEAAAPCACGACARIAAGIHPDVITLQRVGPSQTIPIDTIRSQLIPALALPPHEGKARFFLIEEATSLLDPAANALLKTLEEPPARTHFVLGTSSFTELLPTIKSRCQRVSFQPLSAPLRAELHGGGEAAAALTEQIDGLCRALDRGGLDLYRAAEAAASDKEHLEEILVGLAERLHDAARAAAAAGDLVGGAAHGARARRVLATIRALDEHNAHGQLAVEDLLHAARQLGGPPLAREGR